MPCACYEFSGGAGSATTARSTGPPTKAARRADEAFDRSRSTAGADLLHQRTYLIVVGSQYLDNLNCEISLVLLRIEAIGGQFIRDDRCLGCGGGIVLVQDGGIQGRLRSLQSRARALVLMGIPV